MSAVHAVNLLVGRLISKRRVSIIQPRTINLSAWVPLAIALLMARTSSRGRDPSPSGSSGRPRTSNASRAAWAPRSPGESPPSCIIAEKMSSKNTSICRLRGQPLMSGPRRVVHRWVPPWPGHCEWYIVGFHLDRAELMTAMARKRGWVVIGTADDGWRSLDR